MENRKVERLPKEILATARAVTYAGGDIFAYGGFPKTQFKDALKEGHRRWKLALWFDDAMTRSLGTWHQKTTTAEFTKFLRDANSAKKAENAWLDFIRLWWDPVCQENALERLWALDENCAMDESVFEARIERAELQGRLAAGSLSRDAAIRLHEERIKIANKLGHPVDFQMPRRISEVQRRLIKKKLTDPKLLERARIGFRYLDPDLWRKHVTEQREAGLYSENETRERRGKIDPLTPGNSLGYDAFGVCILYQECYRFTKKERATRRAAGFGTPKKPLREKACERASEALKAIGYPHAPGPDTIQILIKSQPYFRAFADTEI